MEVINNTPEFSTRPRSNSAPQERAINFTSQFLTPQLQANSITTNENSQLNEPQQRRHVRNCNCGLESVLREVKANTVNRGRYFWSCSKFGGPNHLRRCNFFRWDSRNEDDENDVAESSSTAQNRPETPYVLIETIGAPSTLPNTDTNNNDNNDDINNNYEINLSPHPDQLSENEMVMPRSVTRTEATTTSRQRRRRASLPHAPPNTTGTNDTSTIDAIRNLTGDVYTRKPAVFGNWENVPKYSTPQLMDIIQNHLVQQDKNFQRWYTASLLAKKDLEEARKETEKLMKESEVVNRENKLYKRENNVLKAEKRLLEFENHGLKEENQELKRRR